jgi:MOSC domain-containing protein YiiM
MEASHRSTAQLEAGLADALASPQTEGELVAIVVRPEEDRRESRQSVTLTPEGGIEGDRWATATALYLPDGRPDPRAQVSLMNARFLRLIAGDDERMALAGDNLIVDLDLSAANLPVGAKLAIGDVLLEMSDQPHTGCRKFAQRFGQEARLFVNAPEYHALHLRGRYARVLKAGTIRVGEPIRKVE